MNKSQQSRAKRGGCLLRTLILTLGEIGGAVVILIIGIIVGELLLWGIGGALIISDPPAETEAAVVLSGGADDRLEEAFRLYEEKSTKLIILTETGEDVPEYGSYSAIQRFKLLDMGIPAGAIQVTERHVNTTRDEAHVVRRLIEPRGIKSLSVITDPYHSLRTRLVFREEFKDTDIKVYVRAVRGSWYRSSTWWLTPEGRTATLSEYAALLRDYLKINLK